MDNPAIESVSNLTHLDPQDLIRITLRGIGQVMLQEHAGTGLLFLSGIAVASPLLAVGAVIGAVTGPLVAHLMKLDPAEIRAGIHGFNPTLVGIATLFYLEPTVLTWALLVAGCGLSVPVTYLMRRYLPFPTYTAPFIVVAWLMIVVAHAVAGTAIDVKPSPPPHTPGGFITAVLDGPAEVMFGANVVTGLLFLVGIALNDWRQAVLATLGSVVGTLLAMYHGDPAGSISIGIYGYNAALAAIALYLCRPPLLAPLLGALISVPLTEFFPTTLGIPPLTAPFVAATWVVLAIGVAEIWFAPRRVGSSRS